MLGGMRFKEERMRTHTLRLALLAALGLLAAPVFAEQPAPGPWQATADLGLNLNQSSYSNSWAGSEEGAIAWTALANLLAERQFTPSINWRHTLKLSFGQIHREDRDQDDADLDGDREESRWIAPEKSADRIFYESLLRLTLGGFVDPYVSFTFESQFFDGTHPVVNRLFNPITLTESAGIGRTFIKDERTELYSRLGAAVRQLLDRQVTPDELDLPEDDYSTDLSTTVDGGAESVTDFKHTFSPSLNYTSKLRFFQAVFNSKADDLEGLPQEDYWKTPDAAWENTLSASVAKYVQVQLFFELLYDKEIDLRGRYRETLGLGLTYKLF